MRLTIWIYTFAREIIQIMNDYIYREINDKDFPFINRMLLEALADCIPHDSSGQVLSKGDFKNIIAGIIAESKDHTPLGAAWVQKNRFATLFISLFPQYRHQGIGTVLLEKLYSKLSANGIPEIFLSVHNQNKTAINLYKKQGWIVLEDDTEFIQMKLVL